MDALQQFPEVVFPEKSFALFQPFVIQSKAFDHIFFEDLRRPDAKLCGAPGIDPVTDGDDGVKVVDFCLLLLSSSRYCSVWSGYFQIGNNHLFLKLSFLENVLQVLADGGDPDRAESPSVKALSMNT